MSMNAGSYHSGYVSSTSNYQFSCGLDNNGVPVYDETTQRPYCVQLDCAPLVAANGVFHYNDGTTVHQNQPGQYGKLLHSCIECVSVYLCVVR